MRRGDQGTGVCTRAYNVWPRHRAAQVIRGEMHLQRANRDTQLRCRRPNHWHSGSTLARAKNKWVINAECSTPHPEVAGESSAWAECCSFAVPRCQPQSQDWAFSAGTAVGSWRSCSWRALAHFGQTSPLVPHVGEQRRSLSCALACTLCTSGRAARTKHAP
jgi:hypothetical protein